MNLVLVLVVALVTYLSRAAGLVLLPMPSPRVKAILDRVPAPLFAGLAALSLIGEQGTLAPAPVLSGMLGAVLLAPTRSLPIILGGGIAGWTLAMWLLPLLLNLTS